jgi:hypothetical protein
MHFDPHTFWPLGHEQAPPGALQTSPAMAAQSAVVQQVLFGMQELLAAHTCWPLGHAHTPPEQT